MEKTKVEGIRTLLVIGTLTMLLSFLPVVGLALAVVGGLLYLYALYRWGEEVDGRPFKLAIINLILGIVGAGVAIVGLIKISSATSELYVLDILQPTIFSVLGLLYIYLLLMYPFLVAMALIHREVLKCFYEATKIGEFTFAGKLTLYGALLAPALIGLIIGFIARIIEVIAYNKIPTEVEILKGGEIELDKRKVVALSSVALIITLLVLNFTIPSYDVKVVQGDVKFIGKVEGEYIKGAVIYDFPCVRGDGCIKEVKVDGKLVYSGGSYEFVNGKQVVRLTIPRNSKEVEVMFWTGEVVVLHIGEVT
ncbi:hypothetical protein A3L04_03660 [Thermococcus chitonophagus]|uniref:DUF973 family protein n=1 Tax=Thermococcus chitonophagus TaxID=54262 RepID=A0A161KJ78_9EURY|nr:DUF996 domain-containing protein [Thermococcus chitonophagus]ASJ16238.1 hypothetical protein A3L04_03660 [Thermococcus chitonophagus]CUX78784.1 hypothetical protein CHITON_2005 [Thermococcus chitonophagus]